MFATRTWSFSLVLLMATALSHAQETIRNISPPAGRWADLAISSADPRVLYAANNDGYISGPHGALFRSDNSGLSWRQPTGLTNVPIKGLALATDDSDEVYVWTGQNTIGGLCSEAQLLRSRDGGSNWQFLQPGLSFCGWIFDFAISPDNPERLYVLTDQGFWISDDSGEHWRVSEHPLPNFSPVGMGARFAVNPLQPDQLIMAVSTRDDILALFNSSDSGEHWQLLGQASGQRAAVLVYQDHHLFLLSESRPPQLPWTWTLWLSQDDGLTWQEQSTWDNPLDSLNITPSLRPSPHTPGRLMLVLGNQVFESLDSGLNWREYPAPASTTGLRFHPTRQDHLLALHSLGIAITVNEGESWSILQKGLRGNASQAICADYSRPGTLFAIFYLPSEHAWMTRDNGQNWTQLLDPSGQPFQRLWCASGEAPTLYSMNDKGLLRSTDGGQSWAKRSNAFGGGDIYVDPYHSERLIVASSISLQISTNGAASWQNAGRGLSAQIIGNVVRHIAFAPDNPERLYGSVIGIGSGVYVSRNSGMDWQILGLNGVPVYAVHVNPVAPEILLAQTTEGLYRSDNSGASWSMIQTNFPPWFILAAHPVKTDTIVAAELATNTVTPFYSSDDFGLSWAPLPLPLTEILDIHLTPGDTAYVSNAQGIFAINQEPRTETAGLVNLSTLGWVGSDEHTLRAGFIVSGEQPVQVLVKGEGPILNRPDTIANPELVLSTLDGKEIARNDSWRSGSEAGLIALMAQPASEQEAALVATLDPGQYVAELRHSDNKAGLGLVALTDTRAFTPLAEFEAFASGELINISTRGWVSPDSNDLSAGFIVQGEPVRVLIKAEGPILGRADALADPELILSTLAGQELMRNDNWREHPSAAEVAVLAPPASDLEAAFVIELPPGQYVATLRAKANGSGLGLIAVTEIQALAD